ncbi:hypothetical protein [Rhodoluna limnophila]|uniref:hypothetical protein n=1 Tax=Rhodoluna limnophila TaxID=232537 RepID=UPI001105D6E6|nr:hypothetical protein [Rhodoluna limnophila]
MLFLTQNGFLQLVDESKFRNVITLQTNDRAALDAFEELTPSKVMVNVRDHQYPYVLHVRKEVVAEVLDCPTLLLPGAVTGGIVSASPKAYVLEGYDRDYATPVKVDARPDELDGLTKTLGDLENLAIYPVYSVARQSK